MRALKQTCFIEFAVNEISHMQVCSDYNAGRVHKLCVKSVSFGVFACLSVSSLPVVQTINPCIS